MRHAARLTARVLLLLATLLLRWTALLLILTLATLSTLAALALPGAIKMAQVSLGHRRIAHSAPRKARTRTRRSRRP